MNGQLGLGNLAQRRKHVTLGFPLLVRLWLRTAVVLRYPGVNLRLALTNESSHESIDVDPGAHLDHRLHIHGSPESPAGARGIRRANESGSMLSGALGQQQLGVNA